MTHLDEGQILALRDDPGAAEPGARAHIGVCARCRDTLLAARRRSETVAGALHALDAPGQALDAARSAVRLRVARESARTAGGVLLPARRRTRFGWSASKAAGILLLTTAGLSALPGSPVRSWIAHRAAAVAGDDEAAATATEALAPAASAAEEAGVRLPVARGPLAVVIRDAEAGTEIRVTWVPGREAAVFARAGSRFASAEGRLEARSVSGVVRVELPRSLNPVTLEVDGRIYIQGDPAGALTLSGPVTERTDAGVTFRVPPRP